MEPALIFNNIGVSGNSSFSNVCAGDIIVSVIQSYGDVSNANSLETDIPVFRSDIFSSFAHHLVVKYIF